MARRTAHSNTDATRVVETFHRLHDELNAAQIAYATNHTPETKQAQRAATVALDNFLSGDDRPILREAFKAGLLKR